MCKMKMSLALSFNRLLTCHLLILASETAGYKYFSKIVLELHFKPQARCAKQLGKLKKLAHIKPKGTQQIFWIYIFRVQLASSSFCQQLPNQAIYIWTSWFNTKFCMIYFARLMAISSWPWARKSFASSSCHHTSTYSNACANYVWAMPQQCAWNRCLQLGRNPCI